ncbi:N-acetylneuraminate synthase family protein [Tardiphaga sp. vice278]|uniref:N-acetylneuraminate synthase family protein n=1 Tax=Tardiphaga sp. vice278 TaxID=2592815 RepID=UPI0011652578|nr:N-acetylneuraminate synthase family protein [Tardiphaga sp. vice278]QDM17976.1 N-acetylneuraminate synthase [Tardiphaga sp. vice278]
MNPFTSKANPVLFIAEIGGNHEGDFAYAQQLLQLGLESGADIIKFQIYSGDTLVSSLERPDLNKHFKRFELSAEQYIALAEACIAGGAMFMASVWNAAAIDRVDRYIPIHKVGSGDLTCTPLIRKLVQTGKPIILSTGLSSLAEIEATVRFVEKTDPAYISERKLALLQCTSSYPCPDEDVHLLAMETLKSEFGLPVGFSDHSIGSLAVEAAVAMGAEIIEKHFTDTRDGKEFRDHKVSLTRDELRELLPRLRRIVTLRGSAKKHLTVAESDAAHQLSFRRAIYPARDIAAGEVFSEDNLTVLRPAHGLAADRFDEIVGKVARRALKAHEALREEDVG